MSQKNLFILTGCTGVGKTDISMQLAQQINAEIISCDSLLIYKHLNIGTAKPTQDELKKIKHHCIDIAEPNEKFDIQKYITNAKLAIQDIFSKEKNILIVGGTGFYLKSFFYPTIDDITITEEAENFVQNNELQTLINKLLLLNNGQVDIDLKNPRRVASALKRCMSSGLTLSQMKKNFSEKNSEFQDYNKCTILLTRNDENMKNRIHDRTENMIKAGLIDEVQTLLKNKQFGPITSTAIGYRETIEWFTKKSDMATLINNIYTDTLKLIKKQKTWFKKQIPIDLVYNISNKSTRNIVDNLCSELLSMT